MRVCCRKVVATLSTRAGAPHCPLSKRELEVLADVAVGRSNRMIAERLGITERTVKNHLNNIFHALQTRDRTAAVVYALRSGWLELRSLEVVNRGDVQREVRGVA